MFHNGIVDIYSEGNPDPKDYPKAGEKQVQCWFNTKDWQHVSFTPTPFTRYFTVEVIIQFLAVLACILGIVYSVFGEAKDPTKKE